ncbi:MAG TPA: hypothetical protein VGN61_10935 [Verrucomicrobiae bacterium]|jgi:hypothetical protein
MARAILERELNLSARRGSVRFSVATEADDADIRRLFCESPMTGRISLTFEYEPSWFADANVPEQAKRTIIARDGERLACVGYCTNRLRYVNGEARRVGYLGGLRLAADYAGRFDIVRRGYEMFHELEREAPADFYFTSIASDNVPARRFLERGLRGMPTYEFIGEFVTLLLSARAGSAASAIGGKEYHYQFAPCWKKAEPALWDQREFKQTVVRGYSRGLALMRPMLNFAARIRGTPRLPAVGETVANAFVSHLDAAPDEERGFVTLIAGLRGQAAGRGIELLTLGFAADDRRLEWVRRQFRFHEYRSRLYIVRWPDIGGTASELDGRVLAPEVALL